MAESLKQRIDRERSEMNLRPWQYAPSEVFGQGESPYSATPGCAGHIAWLEAQAWCAEILFERPDYFDQ